MTVKQNKSLLNDFLNLNASSQIHTHSSDVLTKVNDIKMQKSNSNTGMSQYPTFEGTLSTNSNRLYTPT